MENNRKITEKDIRIVKVDGKYGYQYPDGTWFAEPEYDEAYEFVDGYATVVKDGLKGWISFDEESDYCPWSSQERWLRNYNKKRERRNRFLKFFGLGPKPMALNWLDDDHSWLINKLHHNWEKFKENPVVPVTIIFGTAVLSYTFFFE